MSEHQPLFKRFADAVKLLELLESSGRRADSDEYKKQAKDVETKLTEIKQNVQQASMFSDNEDIEELSTKQIRYLNVDYYLARFYESNSGAPAQRQQLLKLSKNLYLQFLHNLDNYKVLTDLDSKRIAKFEKSFNPTLDEIRPTDPVLRRDHKIANFKTEKELQNKLKIIEELQFDNLDEEIIREVYKDQLRLHLLKSFQSIESILMELELLKNFTHNGVPKIQEIDSREAPSLKNDFLYTDKLETLTTPLLSKTGKVLRPFTILPNRNSVRSKVFGTGQVLPSMTVEEFLEQELENGGMVSKQEEEKELDEDNDDEVDLETYKQREWDEFKEANAKGSGNTINRG